MGPPDLYVKSGSEITLICKLQQGPHDLGTIYWYKGKQSRFCCTSDSSLFTTQSNPLIILSLVVPLNCDDAKQTSGNDMIQTRIHENDVNSDDVNRISVDTDSSDGLTSR